MSACNQDEKLLLPIWQSQKEKNSPSQLARKNNAVVQNKHGTAGNIHILTPSRALHFGKKALIPFQIELWLENTEVTIRATNADIKDTHKSAPNKVAGISGGAFPSIANDFRRLRSTIQFFSKCRDTLLNLPPLGLLRPEKPITFFKHALYQGSLPFLSNPQNIAGPGKPLWQLKGQTTFLQ